MTQSSGQVNASDEDLTRLSEKLNEMVGRFKV